MQDHSRSGRLEASSLALRKWLFSDAFDAYINLLQVGLRAAPGSAHPFFPSYRHLRSVLLAHLSWPSPEAWVSKVLALPGCWPALHTYQCDSNHAKPVAQSARVPAHGSEATCPGLFLSWQANEHSLALPLQGGGQEPGGDGLLPSTQEYLEKEVVEAAKCQDLFLRIQKYEQIHPVSLKVSPSPFPSWLPASFHSLQNMLR